MQEEMWAHPSRRLNRRMTMVVNYISSYRETIDVGIGILPHLRGQDLLGGGSVTIGGLGGRKV